MSTPYVIMYEGKRERIEEIDDILQRVEEIARQGSIRHGIPYGVDIVRDNGQLDVDPSLAERMVVGVGDGQWMLFHYPGDGSCLCSIGDKNAEGLVLFYFGDWSELTRKYLVPREHALKTLRTWLETGRRGESIEWTTDLF